MIQFQRMEVVVGGMVMVAVEVDLAVAALHTDTAVLRAITVVRVARVSL